METIWIVLIIAVILLAIIGWFLYRYMGNHEGAIINLVSSKMLNDEATKKIVDGINKNRDKIDSLEITEEDMDNVKKIINASNSFNHKLDEKISHLRK